MYSIYTLYCCLNTLQYVQYIYTLYCCLNTLQYVQYIYTILLFEHSTVCTVYIYTILLFEHSTVRTVYTVICKGGQNTNLHKWRRFSNTSNSLASLQHDKIIIICKLHSFPSTCSPTNTLLYLPPKDYFEETHMYLSMHSITYIMELTLSTL